MDAREIIKQIISEEGVTLEAVLKVQRVMLDILLELEKVVKRIDGKLPESKIG